jgi:hypothetical protein
MTAKFKIGDHIKKVEDDQMFKIINLREVRGGNWHDGFDISIIATIESISTINPETYTEEYCVQYINYMCQINNVYATQV